MNASPQHPYNSLPPSAFWKTAVAEKDPLDISRLYRKKFEITAQDKISTAGSCFAQHIGRRLRKGGFCYVDMEPPPPGLLPAERHSEFGYGMFSARYGNIYTTRQLLQLFLRAFGHFKPRNDIWMTPQGRYHDAFRPTVEPDGFSSIDELVTARTHTHALVRRIFLDTDVFVFTLGLTEAWVSSEDGSVYPTCPGVAAGTFDPDLHEFRNFNFDEVLCDMQILKDRLKDVNPGMRILLTVSPVPLTATASGEHVLTATTHSKAVLRAVAGELASSSDMIDYFPSYEIITGAPMRSMFFEPNLRSVASAGVDLVMRHFFEQHPPRGSFEESIDAAPAVTDEDLVCEEGDLERWSAG